MRKTFLVTLLLLLCIDVSARHCSEVSKRTRFRFKLLKRSGLHTDTVRVKINGVYTHEYPGNTAEKKYAYIRFFANGRVYISSVYCSFPDQEELNELRYGSYGYYLVADNKVTVESYSAPGGYCYYYYRIEGDRLVFTGTKKREAGIFKSKEESWQEENFLFYPCTVSNPSFW